MKKIDWDSLPQGTTHFVVQPERCVKIHDGAWEWFIGGQWVTVHNHMVELMEGMYIVERLEEGIVMKQNEFKAGDLVYWPSRGTSVFSTVGYNLQSYPLSIVDHDTRFTVDGRFNKTDTLPELFHATPENKTLLDALYGVEFESPPVKLSGSDLTRKMFTECDAPILCYVNNPQDVAIGCNGFYLRLVVRVEGEYFVDHNNQEWTYATPYCGQVQTVKGGAF
jgi:hypothetical protein